jgi:hypothetical protein
MRPTLFVLAALSMAAGFPAMAAAAPAAGKPIIILIMSDAGMKLATSLGSEIPPRVSEGGR